MSKSRAIAAIAVALLAAMLAACSSVPVSQAQQQRQNAYAAAAGAPVRSFVYLGRMWSWEPLGDRQLVVYTTPNKAYLLDVWGCPNLPWTQVIGLTASFHEVQANFDKVLAGGPYPPCPITQIRPLDLTRLKLAQQSPREVDVQSRNDAATPPGQAGQSGQPGQSGRP
ncbi:MAG TPA: DUF6491 family protein [Dyella sp.]|uniref:DUF6491 family protein n=1 Tax=Dyella sp. TaxID=1869338 RepID=UPI002B9D3397|nr:DUF6491 family protein [Dyella sp.]HTV84592.1 DUF6491 family protein [Dyella sp.]